MLLTTSIAACAASLIAAPAMLMARLPFRAPFPVASATSPPSAARTVAAAPAAQQLPLTAIEIAGEFSEPKLVGPQIQDVLISLNRLGDVESFDNGRSFIRIAG
ncbi:hypothetical protein [Rhizobium changzhiense]|uniref:Uncharacterized protein n=1 Tax=Rhizobium changzhiense TaxID=2692317 RepID=A0A7Z0ZW26_9HYPH|nr:hypothetical protein [Rhizobium changzhiense]MBA5800458.1 hypothetical protein [Rhizobium changzhiense]MCH4547409.1 hypothetical protein [Rhizobium changzhiense]NZD66055.1 hypothetical protein [Rhizobium changzhiense]